MLEILLATNNEHKLEEFREIFKGYDVRIYSLKDLNINVDPEETGKTFFDNALIKCETCKKYTNLPIIADDSGIEIAELGEHFPGIYSHRYMEEMGGQEKCLKYLVEHHLGSKAVFHCSIVLINIEEKPIEFVGEVHGTISKIVANDDFGYDPVFKVDGLNKTYAEIDPKEKDKLSHRYLASVKLLNYLKEHKYI